MLFHTLCSVKGGGSYLALVWCTWSTETASFGHQSKGSWAFKHVQSPAIESETKKHQSLDPRSSNLSILRPELRTFICKPSYPIFLQKSNVQKFEVQAGTALRLQTTSKDPWPSLRFSQSSWFQEGVSMGTWLGPGGWL